MHLRCVWLENICNAGGDQASNKSEIPYILPPFLHILLTGLYAEEPSAGRVIMVPMIGSTQAVLRCESATCLWRAQKAAGAKGD